MITIANIGEIKSDAGLVIGNFDGVHLGHQSLLAEVVASCQKSKLATVLVTFWPHPKLVLTPKRDFLINSPEEKRELLSALGIDYLMEIEFTRDFSDLLPEKFLDQYIFPPGNNFSVKKLFIGHDFTFGKNKGGDHAFVENYCSLKKIAIEIEAEFAKEGVAISSSVIRHYLKAGNIEMANQLLGRLFLLAGRVIKGDGRGRMLGFPTANIQISTERLIPPFGVYVTQTKAGASKIYNSITNIGTNPTFKAGNIINVETNIFDFDKDLYGEEISVAFIKRLRSEKKFPSANDLIYQITADVSAARNHFKTNI
ncbi:MAG: riboflavin biosynthesis protein RibF [Bdellovibrionales bacterium RIFOXYD12_FULL_39_22]|nr:MAG: riboflavin biosynthesis protein RibF [Bdellovibrionales bacterium RIFOXYB1_FULL_39_21]OFZ45272.1 MAG: riboflavin biosynthesis protein RibF [Bdellovibrionales bacterium RIFOXYC12_FULL_39_17]OFZ45538.1 MAG: riboflavin biosynthesis protein RibF [Bdellovibrionales bacterium RIFOXYC1_FULL_39_130]OFZ68307.1 MAG: riboflavin biosynthesis protein RibF [Bdellovibrionales bacterium RIFOXYC2_FULL_39_8]OFZ77399.1 MAG: riboflavin biosynthesis protein RibF [Bdellovibrionales bacterium RIFOXYD1_FULL_39